MSRGEWHDRRTGLSVAVILIGTIASATAWGKPLSGVALVTALRHGGYVLVMRHASSPPMPPTADKGARDNTKLERELDEPGRGTAEAMGAAIEALRIPVGETWSSPTYRALETARLARLPSPKTAAELGDSGESMRAVPDIQSAWLRAKAAELPRAGTDTIIVTQLPNIVGAFPSGAASLVDGEALVVLPDGAGGEEIVGRVKIEEWPLLAARP